MRKPAGVIAAAVVMGLMAVLGTLCVSLSLVVFLFMHNPVNIPGFRVIVVLSNLFVLGFFLFSGWTVVGLLHMRRWARVAGVVIGAVVCLFSGGGAIGMLAIRNVVPVVPPTPGEPATILSSLPLIFVGVAALYLAIAIVGLWWAVYFSLPRVREAFTGIDLMVTYPEIVPHGGSVTIAPETGGGAGWRVVVVVWAGLMLVGILYVPMIFVMHAPLFLFGAVVGGGAETACVALMTVLQLVLGIGLIRKWKFVWYLAIAWQVYVFAYALSFLIPGMWDRFIAYEVNLSSQWSSPGIAQMMTSAIFHGPFFAICFGLGIVVVILFTIALFKRKEDYLGA